MRDPISNLIVHLKNGTSVKKDVVVVPHSNFTASVAEALARKGYVKPPFKKGKKIQKLIEIGLIYNGDNPRIHGITRLSKPSKRLYKGYSELYPIKQGYGSTFLSTPKGILSDDEARKEKVGGEILFNIW